MVKEIKLELIVGGWNTRAGQSETGSWRSLRPVVGDACTRCGNCDPLCPEAAITLGDIMAEVDYRYCKGCGVCSNICPVKAIEMVAEK